MLRGALASAVCLLSLRAGASWLEPAENDGVYGRLRGDADLSLKLGGQWSERRVAGSLGASIHYYWTLGLSLDYVEALASNATQTRGVSVGTELRPLFLPRFLMGWQRGPAWLDLTLDSMAIGFGGYWDQAEPGRRNELGVWLSGGLGVPLTGHSSGPWVELRAQRRFPDPGLERRAYNVVVLYLSWHHVAQIASAR